MKELVDWLISIEEIAGNLYDGASKQFAYNKELSGFLGHLAEDEGWHYHIMGSAAAYLNKEGDIASELALDIAFKEKIEFPFKTNYEMLSNGTLTQESLIDCIIETEYSEWNQFFVYVVNTLKLRSREFMYAASKMQYHIEEITEFLKSLPDGAQYIKKVEGIPQVWRRSFLVVEDFEPVRTVLKALLDGEGNVDTANNGAEALKKVTSSYYDVIISDIKMPLMNGVDFCREALKIDPAVGKKFIFCSSSSDEEFMNFIQENSIRFIKKPMNISDLRSHIREILSEIP